MKSKEILKLVIDKINKSKQLVNDDYTKGKISAMERHTSIVYLEQVRVDIQTTLESITQN